MKVLLLGSGGHPPSARSVRFILNNRFIPCIEYFAFGQMLRHRTPRKQHDTNQTAY